MIRSSIPVAVARACLAALLVLSALIAGCAREQPRPQAPTGTATETRSPAPSHDESSPPAWPPRFSLEKRWSGFENPVQVTFAPGEPDRLFVVEQGGRIRVIEGGSVRQEPFLDISGLVSAGGERGLLGLALDPDFATSGLFVVDYTDKSGDTIIATYRVTPDGTAADPATASIRLRIEQPFPNHNGGQIAFGPDGYLYIGTGDGGGAGDPQGNAQDPGSSLGKILRIDVRSRVLPYGIPDDNPFRNREGYRPEIWALGLRNPWRFSFDRSTGDLYIGDVGQKLWEEIDVSPAGTPGGANFGWNLFEGTHPYPPGASRARDPERYVEPVVEYGHDVGRSVTGGFVYRGSRMPALRGVYVYGDYVTGRIWALARIDGVWRNELVLDTNLNISAFGEDAAGELYVVDHARGDIHAIVP